MISVWLKHQASQMALPTAIFHFSKIHVDMHADHQCMTPAQETVAILLPHVADPARLVATRCVAVLLPQHLLKWMKQALMQQSKPLTSKSTWAARCISVKPDLGNLWMGLMALGASGVTGSSVSKTSTGRKAGGTRMVGEMVTHGCSKFIGMLLAGSLCKPWANQPTACHRPVSSAVVVELAPIPLTLFC